MFFYSDITYNSGVNLDIDEKKIKLIIRKQKSLMDVSWDIPWPHVKTDRTRYAYPRTFHQNDVHFQGKSFKPFYTFVFKWDIPWPHVKTDRTRYVYVYTKAPEHSTRMTCTFRENRLNFFIHLSSSEISLDPMLKQTEQDMYMYTLKPPNIPPEWRALSGKIV